MLLKLLLVEDDLASLDLMTEVFSSEDVEVRAVNDSNYAAQLIQTEKFDGIFLDLQMPNLHGFELTRRIRESVVNKGTPITVVTGWDERTAMQQVFNAGATFYLQKPVDRQRLLRLFRTIRGTMLQNRRDPCNNIQPDEVAHGAGHSRHAPSTDQ